MLISRRVLMFLPLCMLAGVLAGCTGYGASGASWIVDGGYWSVDVTNIQTEYDGGDFVSLTGDVGLDDETESYYGLIMYEKGRDSYGLGYDTMAIEGSKTLSADTTWGGTTFTNGSTVDSDFNLDRYQIVMTTSEAESAQAMTTISMVIEYMDFNIGMVDAAVPTTNARYDDTSLMFVFGMGYEWTAGTGQSYFVDGRYMDLDVIRLDHTGGTYTDVTGGLKWSVGGATGSGESTIIVGYRYTDIDLDISGNELKLEFEGPVIGVHLKF